MGFFFFHLPKTFPLALIYNSLDKVYKRPKLDGRSEMMAEQLVFASNAAGSQRENSDSSEINVQSF